MGPNPLLKLPRWNAQSKLVAMDWELEHFTLQAYVPHGGAGVDPVTYTRAPTDDELFLTAWQKLSPAHFRRLVLWGSKWGGSIAESYRRLYEAVVEYLLANGADVRGDRLGAEFVSRDYVGCHMPQSTSETMGTFGRDYLVSVFLIVRYKVNADFFDTRPFGFDFYSNSPAGRIFLPAIKWRRGGAPASVYGEPGTLIHGTLREEDLLEAFGNELMRLDPSNFDRITNAWLDVHPPQQAEGWPTREWVDAHPEDAQEMIQEFADALDELSPPGHYFGAHPGDGADFGFWPHDPGADI